ncbi:MAG: hypothetical protein ACRDI1_12395 [Actinomycetota bacterium]
MNDAANGDEYHFSQNPDGVRSARPRGVWVRAEGGDLPFPVELRLHQDANGRYVVTGLLIGDEFDPREITSLALRRIKLSEILAAFFTHMDYEPGAPTPYTLPDAVDLVARANAVTASPARPARGPDDATLRAFAHTYRTELARQPRRAMSAAADAHGISRATANRWAQLCRDLGYLPGKSSPPEEEE